MIMILMRSAIYAIIALASIGFLYAIESKPPLIPHGLYLPAIEQTFPAHEGNVAVVKIPPLGAKIIGTINMQMRLIDAPNETQERQLLEKVTALAAQKGAEGIALNYFFATQGEGGKSYLLQALAFRTM
jgi:hypothetical protein